MKTFTRIALLMLVALIALTSPAYSKTSKENSKTTSANDTNNKIKTKFQGIWIATATSFNKGVNYKRVERYEFAYVSDDTIRLGDGNLLLVDTVTHDKVKDLFVITFKRNDAMWCLSEVKGKGCLELSLINLIDGEPIEVSRIFIKVQKQDSLK